MGVYKNGKKLGQPYFNGKKMNAYLNGKKLWSGEYNEFIPESEGTFDLIYEGLNIDNAPTDVQAEIVAYQVIGWENPRSIDYLKIPSEHNGKPVTELYKLASSLSEEITIDNLLIGSNVKRVHSAVLPLGDIVSVINYAYFPTTITKLNHNADEAGMNLNIKHIYFNCISAEVEYSDGKLAFYNPWELRTSAMTTVTIGKDVTLLKEGLFYNEALVVVSFEEKSACNSIGDSAFWGCSALTDINIPDAITSIGDNTFRGCSALTTIDIPTKVETIGNYAFANCIALTDINIPESVTSIGIGTFRDCSSLINVIIPERVTSIGNYAFQNCSSLTNITIPSGVKSIGTSAFYGCSLLETVFINSQTIANTETNVGGLFTNAQTVYVLDTLTVGSYITTNYGYQETSDGYKKYIRGEE